LELEKVKSKKSLVFAEMICDLPSLESDSMTKELIPDESLFLIDSYDLWYEYIIIYLHTQTFHPDILSTVCLHIRYQACQYIILVDTLYQSGIDSIFQ
jgi:hypothetical protein